MPTYTAPTATPYRSAAQTDARPTGKWSLRFPLPPESPAQSRAYTFDQQYEMLAANFPPADRNAQSSGAAFGSITFTPPNITSAVASSNAVLVAYTVLARDLRVWARLGWWPGLPIFLLLVVPWFESEPAPAVPGLDSATAGDLAHALAAKELSGKPFEMYFTTATATGFQTRRLLLLGAACALPALHKASTTAMGRPPMAAMSLRLTITAL